MCGMKNYGKRPTPPPPLVEEALRTLERRFRQEPQNDLGVNKQQGRKKNQFLLKTNSGQQCVQAEEK